MLTLKMAQPDSGEESFSDDVLLLETGEPEGLSLHLP